MEMDLSRNVNKGLKMSCISDKTDGRKDQEKFANVWSEHENVTASVV
jgi:hypothetical protein